MPVIDPATSSIERRRTDRIDSVVRATVRGHVPGEAGSRARAVDLCEHGARVLVRRGFAVGARVTLQLECELPLRVHLGFDAHSLVVDGPMHTHLVELDAVVVRAQRLTNRMCELGVEFAGSTAFEARQVVQGYLDHLRELEDWTQRGA